VIRALLIAVVATAAVAGPAHAIERDCPSGQVWSPNLGACVARQASPQRTAQGTYYAAIAKLESSKPADRRAAQALLVGTCQARHAPSCTLLGFVLEQGRTAAADPRTAVAQYQRACDLGDLDGCIGAASVWARGLLGEPDPARAIAPLTRACELGSGKGCYTLAGKYEVALGVARDDGKATALYERAFSRLRVECPKSGPACYFLGNAYLAGKGTAVDATAGARALSSGCDVGSGASCVALGEQYRGQHELDRALGVFDRACQQYDNADGCHAAGEILAERADGDHDAARLTDLAERACRLATASCDLAGYLFATGKGGTRDETAATAAYVQACQAGNPTACSAAAARIAHGTGTPADGPLAVKIWERACETGSGEDCYQAAIAHRDGELVPADPARSVALLGVGCVRKSPRACEDAGEALRDGVGIAVDPPEAMQYLAAGCALGRGETCTILGDDLRDGASVEVDREGARAAYQRGCTAATPDAAACAAWGALADDPAASLLASARACRLGEPASCRGLDAQAAATKPDDATRSRALAALQEGCDAAPAVDAACVALAQIYGYGGTLTARAPRRAFAIAGDACQRGARGACLELADYYASGLGVVADVARARVLYQTLCDQDRPAACWSLGNLLLGDDRHDDATRLFARACDDGLAAACNSLAYSSYIGRGAAWDMPYARQLYARACELGDEFGCANLGELDELGVAGPADPVAAATHYAQACGDGAVAGCARLGAMVERGEGGLTRDLGRAEALQRRGCEAGAAEACRGLAELLDARGSGDAVQRARLRQRAFDLARDEAGANPYQMYLLGTFHRDGIGTARDPTAARQWLDRSCAARDPYGCIAAGEAHHRARQGEAAVASFDRACAAGVERACERAASVRRDLPLNGHGCACGTSRPDAGGAALALLVLGWVVRRRR